ncbi:MFS transporter [Cryptococcus wingfieldii CBS 7118]|uniref:MFS transporter n=1 Tax=Cryptococcus wingfieldii CBS 7118 TaxID=1295528 RepID=A0A1E3IB53_9TREE|nr:MFS transporter [Cryptococcus wingfieldii CBS 7118]ODN85645.1 MFS transporter [Cryptococcus wingfieldii CBS 7118]
MNDIQKTLEISCCQTPIEEREEGTGEYTEKGDCHYQLSMGESGRALSHRRLSQMSHVHPRSITSATPSTDTEPEVNLPPTIPPQAHFLDGKGSLFRVTFISVACATQLLAQSGTGLVMFPLHAIGKKLGTDDQGELSWMVASYGQVLGLEWRLGDLYGPKRWWAVGLVIMSLSNIGSGFCKSPIPFDITRALSGAGSAIALPNALAILGRTYPPGKTRNVAFSILGALAPLGYYVGGMIGAIFGQLVIVGWIFWFVAILMAALLVGGWFVLPPDEPHPDPSQRHFDYLGAVLLATSLGLLNFCWNQAPLADRKWQEPYIYTLLVVSLVGFAVFFWWERRIGKKALVPVEMLKKESLLVYLCLWLGWMSLGTFLLYSSFLQVFSHRSKCNTNIHQSIYDIRGYTQPLVLVAQMFPLLHNLTLIIGMMAALLVPHLIHRLPGHIIFLLAMLAFTIGNLLAATAPAHSTYWGNTFVSMLVVVWGPDLSFSTGQLIVSGSVDKEFQGIAAGIVSMITNYS